MAALSPSPSAFAFRDATILALSRLDPHASGIFTPWSVAEAAALHGEAARQLSRQTDAVVMLGSAVSRLTNGIALVPFLSPGGPFGPAWAGHPFASPAMEANYKLREPDVTRALAAFMGPGAGRQGARRAVMFLRLLAELAGADGIRNIITDQTRPTVLAEHPVFSPRQRSPSISLPPYAATRIDLLFEWPLDADGRRAVVVIEAKLGAVVSEGQLLSYREEAKRRAKGGPVALILLTGWADAAERRYRSWLAVRWFGLLRRWEALLADAGDDDPEFARVRAHLWHFVLSNRRAHQ